jgi:deoxyribodipyrimidine photo-lyase
VWLRNDLRLTDNPAFAATEGHPVVPLYVWSPEEEGAWPPGAATRRWLERSLHALDASLRGIGSRLIVRTGPSARALEAVIRETGACAVHWNARHEPGALERDAGIAAEMSRLGCRVRTFTGSTLVAPGALLTSSGRPYQVFTPFCRALLAHMARNAPSPPAALRLPPPNPWPASDTIASLSLEASAHGDPHWQQEWAPGESGAQEQLTALLADRVGVYADRRDRPGILGTSRLSPHLRFGEIGPAQVWRAASPLPGGEAFLRQLAWREFAHHLLHHFPHTGSEPLRREFSAFAWRDEAVALDRWSRGLTGFPIVDAGMRQLRSIGWMHNRVRMIVASFLTKDLLIPWQAGAQWFWETLVDADLANNTLGWQWTAGCGADAAPYFRILSPVAQGMRFDPDGAYVRRWAPELARLPDAWIHRPWDAPESVLTEAGVRLGNTYPMPIVDHAEARERALDAFRALRTGPVSPQRSPIEG